VRKKKPLPRKSAKASPGDVLILKQLDDINRKLVVVLSNQKKFSEALDGKLPISAELEAQVTRARSLSTKIDRQVPDKPTKKE
jgi:hypothetical protein